jgi:hypothetical protein
LFQQFCAHEPVFAIIDVRPGVEGIPTTAYVATEEVQTDGKEIQRVFKHIACHIEAEEAEEVMFCYTFIYYSFIFFQKRQILFRLASNIF